MRLNTRTTRVGLGLFLERTSFHVFKFFFMRLYFMGPADIYRNLNSLVGYNAKLEECQKQRFHTKETSASGKYKLLP